jgi:hypothetical protein
MCVDQPRKPGFARLCVDMRAWIMMSCKRGCSTCSGGPVYMQSFIPFASGYANHPNFGSGFNLSDNWLVWHVKVVHFLSTFTSSPLRLCLFVLLNTAFCNTI